MNQQSINVDLTKIKSVKCVCGNTYFEKSYVIKKIPALMVGATQDVMSPVEIYRCDKADCKKVLPDFEKAIADPVELKVVH